MPVSHSAYTFMALRKEVGDGIEGPHLRNSGLHWLMIWSVEKCNNLVAWLGLPCLAAPTQ